jgi:16S rRNA (cytosine1402-N4)-methyltransferase
MTTIESLIPGDLRHAATISGHQSVMREAVLAGLAPRSGGVYLDGTFGGGGHTRAILEASAPAGQVVALDWDAEAIERGAPLLADYPDRFQLLRYPFSALASALDAQGVSWLDGALFDLGVSSWHLDQPERGFSFRADGPLDMRMDTRTGPTAAELINRLSPQDLAHVFYTFGEERHSRRIAQAIYARRKRIPFRSTRELAEVVETLFPHGGRIHPATRVFQALRIAVNAELDELHTGVVAALNRLAPGGRLVVISFHSLEDRIVKRLFRAAATGRTGDIPPDTPPLPACRLITPKPLSPDHAEVRRNPRARSARMRIIERSPGEGSLSLS